MALEPFYLERLRALQRLDGLRCPGEEVCTTDITNGVIAKKKGHTLENYCHNLTIPPKREEGQRRRKDALIIPGCPRFPTKPESTPRELSEVVYIAETLRRHFKLAGAGEWVLNLPATEFECLAIAKECEDVVSIERQKGLLPGGGSGASASSAGEGTGVGGRVLSNTPAPLTEAFAEWDTARKRKS